MSRPSTAVGEDHQGAEPARGRSHRLLRDERSGGARVGGESGRSRVAHFLAPRAEPRSPNGGGVRSRSGAAGGYHPLLRGGAVAEGDLRWLGAAIVSENLRLERTASLCAAEYRHFLR